MRTCLYCNVEKIDKDYVWHRGHNTERLCPNWKKAKYKQRLEEDDNKTKV